MCGISTFAEVTTVAVDSAIKVPDDIPLDKACLVGCGVGTGWGSAVNSAEVAPGDTVIVMGVGGIGINAVQGAAHAGASHVIAVDPVEFKREKAMRARGHPRRRRRMEEATEIAQSFTNGQGADSAIVTVGVTTGEHLGQAMASIRKAGTVVVTGLGNIAGVGAPVSLADIALFQKRIQGSLFGASNPKTDIPKLLRLYQEGSLKLDELVTRDVQARRDRAGLRGHARRQQPARRGPLLRGRATHPTGGLNRQRSGRRVESMTDDKRITVQRTIDAPTQAVFDVLSQPRTAPRARRVGLRHQRREDRPDHRAPARCSG